MHVTPLRRHLFEGRIEQKAVAAATGIHTSEVSRIVSGMDPGPQRAQAIAGFLGATCTDLGWPQYDTSEQAA